MSRIIVKNLPSKADESDVRKHFASKGRITDVKVMRKRDGSSRRFAFVGFTSDSEAQEAAQYFNLSFMNSSRLDVSIAKALGDESLQRRKESLKRKRLEQREEHEQETKTKDKKPIKDAKDSKLDEFLSVMQPQRATAMWKNDSTDISARSGAVQHGSNALGNTKGLNDNDDEEDIVDLRALHNDQSTSGAENMIEDNENNFNDDFSNANIQQNEDEQQDEQQDEEPDWVPQAKDGESDEEADHGGNTEMSDLDWLRQRQTRIKENDEKPEPIAPPVAREDDENIQDMDAEDDMKHEGGDQQGSNNTNNNNTTTNNNIPTQRLFLRNLAFTVSRTDLEQLFSPYGSVKQVHIPVDPRTDKPKGIAFVEFSEVEEAVHAQEELDGTSFQGRLLHIIFAEEQRSYQLDEFDIKNMPLKKQRALKRRMQAAKQQFSWNSLYMNKDTVLEATAAKLGLTKSQIMDPTSSNMAVQQALAESSVLESVQSYFRGRGVDLTKFQARSQELSDTIILAKNLPYSTSPQEIQDIFAEYGEVVRTLMPPDGGIAIIQFKLASAGRSAFRKLAFRRIGDSILYLQKAPKGVLDESAPESTDEEPTGAAPASSSVSEKPKSVTSAADIILPSDNAEASSGADADIRTSVFIKNLNFETSIATLTKLFQPLPGFIAAIIKQKPDPKNEGRHLSMGFGFAEFRTLNQAETAIKTLQGTVLDGHSLQLKISSRGSGDGSNKASKAPTTAKIVIKNIPFETSKKDVVDLFGTFGKLRSVRVPRKFNRQTRGFAFAEFATPGEAEHAMASLQGAHLLGRRLVMDYAQADTEDPEAEIAKMEAKVAQQVSAEDMHGRQLRGQQKGFDMDNLDD